MRPGREAGGPPLDPLGLVNLVVVYIVWGSTFLAMRVGVRAGSGFPSWLFGGTRVAVAGLILIVLAVALRRRLRVSRRTLVGLAVSGVLIWVGAHGLLLWAERWAEAGYAALFLATFPIWAALADGLLDRRAPSGIVMGSLLLGLAGIATLTWPELGPAGSLSPLVLVALIIGPVAWALGFTVQRRMVQGVDPFVGASYQHLVAFPFFFLIASATWEPWPDPVASAWWAWGYLVVFGSVVAFTAAHVSLRRLPPRIAMTYGYVNPVVAVVLGHLLLNERVTAWTVVGAVLVIAGVYGVFQERRVPATPEAAAQATLDAQESDRVVAGTVEAVAGQGGAPMDPALGRT